jgi:hypothetical protein
MLLRPLHLYSSLYSRQVWVRRALISSGTDSVRVMLAGGIVVLTPTAAALWQTLVRFASCCRPTVAQPIVTIKLRIIELEIRCHACVPKTLFPALVQLLESSGAQYQLLGVPKRPEIVEKLGSESACLCWR